MNAMESLIIAAGLRPTAKKTAKTKKKGAKK